MRINTVQSMLFRQLREVCEQRKAERSRNGRGAGCAMISGEKAARFATDWIAAWNARDLGRILACYAEDFEMSSPKIVQFLGEASGALRGKEAVGSYWRRALELRPDLHFRLLGVFPGERSVCIRYESLDGQNAVEWFEFNDDFLVRRAEAYYGSAREQ